MLSKSAYYKRLKRARELGCSVDDVPDMRGRHTNHCCGSGHPRWNHERMVDSEGYVLIRVGCEHPFADPNGYAREHVLVVLSSQSFDAACLLFHPDRYVIHHRNRDRKDNRIENLQVLTREEHNALHNADDRERNESGQFVGKATAGRLLDGREWNEMQGPRRRQGVPHEQLQ